MRSVAVNLIGITAPGIPRRMVVALKEGATVRSLLEELSERGGEGVRRAIWTEDGRVERSLLIAVDGEVVDPSSLDDRLSSRGDPAEVSLFLIRPISGGSTDPIRLDREGGVLIVTIDRPEAKNALNLETIEALSEVVDGLARDPALRAVVVTGAGGAFVSGGDVKDFLRLESPEAGKRMSERTQSVLARLEALEVPVIAAMEGVALGGGAEVSLACDIRIASESARIAFKQVSLGIMVGWGGGQRLLRIVGRSRALRLLLTGVTLTAQEAARFGLVDEVVPAGQALEAALALARQIAAQPAAAVRATKRALHHGAEVSRAEAAAFEAECFGTLWQSSDHREAVAALMERRAPVIRGRDHDDTV